MGLYALIRNGMGDVDAGTGAEEDDFLYFSNYYLLQNGRVDSGDLAVSERGAGANMSVDVAAGKAFIPNASYTVNADGQTRFWTALNTAVYNVPISANVSGNPRIDIIVIKMNTATAPDDEASNVITIEVVEGTPAGSPVAEATPSNSYKLAEIAVANGAVSIVDADITDTRDYAYLNLSKGVVPNEQGLYFLNSAGDIDHYIKEDSTGNLLLTLGTTAKGFYFRDETPENIAMIDDDGVTIYNGRSLSVESAGGDKNVEIYHDDTNAIIQLSSGSLYLIGAGSLIVRDSASSDSVSLSHNGTRGALTSQVGDLLVGVDNDGDKLVIVRHPRRTGAGTNTYPNSHIQSGWGYIVGDGTNEITATVTFPVAFSSDNVRVVVGFIGTTQVVLGTPDDEGWFGNNSPRLVVTNQVTTTSFGVSIYGQDGADTLSSSINYGFSWIAIGPA